MQHYLVEPLKVKIRERGLKCENAYNNTVSQMPNSLYSNGFYGTLIQ